MTLPPDMIAEFRAELERQLARLERSMLVSEEAVRPVELDQRAVGRLFVVPEAEHCPACS
jgi:hypothetical protein